MAVVAGNHLNNSLLARKMKMKTFWFVACLLVSQITFGQQDEFESLMDLYSLNQNEVEERLGYSCNIHVNFSGENIPKTPSQKKVFHASERYMRVASKGESLRLDTHYALSQSDSSMDIFLKENSLKTKTYLLRAQRGQGELMRAYIEKFEKPNQSSADWKHSPFEVFKTFPAVYESNIKYKYRYTACIKSEEKGRDVWTCLVETGKASHVFTFDKDIEYLPVSVVIKLSEDHTDTVSSKAFTGNERFWKKAFASKIDWQKDESADVYVPRKIEAEHLWQSMNTSAIILYKNWKLGEQMDATLIDPDEFRNLTLESSRSRI
jgi:hypothetical protein